MKNICSGCILLDETGRTIGTQISNFAVKEQTGEGGVRVIAVGGGGGICTARVFVAPFVILDWSHVVVFFFFPLLFCSIEVLFLLVDGLTRTFSQEFIFSDSAELTPLEDSPELDCFPAETLLIVEKPLVQDCRLVIEPR